MPIFGQVVVGPPGAGKSTYCLGMHMFCQEIGRKAAIINLDFANDALPYTATLDVRNFLTLQVRAGLLSVTCLCNFTVWLRVNRM